MALKADRHKRFKASFHVLSFYGILKERNNHMLHSRDPLEFGRAMCVQFVFGDAVTVPRSVVNVLFLHFAHKLFDIVSYLH